MANNSEPPKRKGLYRIKDIARKRAVGEPTVRVWMYRLQINPIQSHYVKGSDAHVLLAHPIQHTHEQ